MEKHPLHLKDTELQTSPEVNRAVLREEHRIGEKIPNNPTERIEVYMDRLENIFLNPDKTKRERNLEMFRDKIYDAFIIKKENFPESYFELQKRIARERGQAVEEIPENVREQMMDVAIEDQRVSLDAWINYLSSKDATYPAWYKYFVWKNITKLSQFDKERGEFKKRTDSTVAPYPDIYREPLAQIADIYLKIKEDNKNLKEPEIREAFSKKFPTLYAELISKSLAASIENREEIKGEWRKYPQGQAGAAEQLFTSLEGKGTGWCTAGKSTAETQIENGDFYVYYTNNSKGNPTQPRLAIRMEGNNKIGEVRGILPHQDVEPILQEVLQEKLKDFGSEADIYRKKVEDMKKLTDLDKKHGQEIPFTKDDLLFLYEINSPIESFGYETDPRIAEIRKERNAKEDVLVIFECTKEEIAYVPSQITKDTKAYIGQLEPGIFQKLPESLEYVYTAFPEKKINRESVEVGGRTAEQLIAEMETAHIHINKYAKYILENPQFIPGKNRDRVTLIQLTVEELGFKTTATTEQIYERAQSLGLKLCPIDTGPSYRIKYKLQPPNDLDGRIYIAMKQVVDNNDSENYEHIFNLANLDEGLELRTAVAHPHKEWDPISKFIFLLPKSTS